MRALGERAPPHPRLAPEPRDCHSLWGYAGDLDALEAMGAAFLVRQLAEKRVKPDVAEAAAYAPGRKWLSLIHI